MLSNSSKIFRFRITEKLDQLHKRKASPLIKIFIKIFLLSMYLHSGLGSKSLF